MSSFESPMSRGSAVPGGLCRVAFAALDSDNPSRERRHAVARAVLARLGGFPDESVESVEARWEEGEFGKPRLVGGPEFSFSYSGPWVAVAVADGPIGIDLEQIRPLRMGDASLVLTASERAHVAASPDRDEALLRIWTRKEAISKAAGVGMHAPFRELEALEVGPVSLAGRSWHVMDLEGPAGTLVSLASASPVEVRGEVVPLVECLSGG